MYGGKVELCGVDTSRLPVLTEAEKSALIRAARAGDQAARQQMIQGNLRLVLRPSTTLTRHSTCGFPPTACR